MSCNKSLSRKVNETNILGINDFGCSEPSIVVWEIFIKKFPYFLLYKLMLHILFTFHFHCYFSFSLHYTSFIIPWIHLPKTLIKLHITMVLLSGATVINKPGLVSLQIALSSSHSSSSLHKVILCHYILRVEQIMISRMYQILNVYLNHHYFDIQLFLHGSEGNLYRRSFSFHHQLLLIY